MKLTHRVGSLQPPADTLAKQALERKAFGLDDKGDKDDKSPNAYEVEGNAPEQGKEGTGSGQLAHGNERRRRKDLQKRGKSFMNWPSPRSRARALSPIGSEARAMVRRKSRCQCTRWPSRYLSKSLSSPS